MKFLLRKIEVIEVHNFQQGNLETKRLLECRFEIPSLQEVKTSGVQPFQNVLRPTI